MKTYQNPPIHPLCSALPDMPDREFQELMTDIQENGLREPIVIHEGMILDGRHRARALRQLGIDLDEETVDEYDIEEDGDPAKFVISRNIHRRNLTPKERAAIVLELLSAGRRTVRQEEDGLRLRAVS